MGDTVSEKKECHGQKRADVKDQTSQRQQERRGQEFNHQGAEESRVWRPVSISAGTRREGGAPGGMERRPEENTHPICVIFVSEKRRRMEE